MIPGSYKWNSTLPYLFIQDSASIHILNYTFVQCTWNQLYTFYFLLWWTLLKNSKNIRLLWHSLCFKFFYLDRESPRKSHDFVYEKMEKPYDTWVWDCNSLFRSYTAGGYNSTGLSVSLVLNHRSFVRDWKPVVWITRLLMFDVLSNEKSRKSRRGFDLLTLTHCWRICQKSMLLKYFPPKNKHGNESTDVGQPANKPEYYYRRCP